MEIAIPKGISEAEVKEWLSILVERKVNQEMNSNPAVIEATTKAKAEIDTFRKSIGLEPKFEKVEEAKES